MIVKDTEDKMKAVKIVWIATLVVMLMLAAKYGQGQELSSKPLDPTHNSIDAYKWHSFVVKDTERATAKWTAVNEELARSLSVYNVVMRGVKEERHHKCLLTYWGMGVTGTDAEEACK